MPALARFVARTGVQSSTQARAKRPMKRAPGKFDRAVDVAAILLVLAGVALFFYARSVLVGMGNETGALPKDGTAVALADFHVAQTRMGLFLVALGLLVGVAAAVRHKLKA